MVETMAEVGISEYKPDIDGNRKRKKSFGDERLHRNRERNRLHARKTRERKKQQSNALQSRLTELEAEGNKLRQIVDDRYTASVLLGLSQTFQNSLGENHNIMSSANVCSKANSLCSFTTGTNFVNPSDGNAATDLENSDNKDPSIVTKRVRRRGKYTSQERERIRRERNRMHAKRTRDRKKKLLEDSESIIIRMERESHLLRGYCVSLNMLSAEDATKFEERASESKRELAALKASQGEYDVDCDEDDDNDYNNNDDNGDGDDEHDNDGSLSGSDDNEKSCSWNGSNNGTSDNGSDSINGDTSGDARSSGSNSRSESSSNTHNSSSSSNDSNNIGSNSSNSSNSHNSGSGSGSGSGSDSPVPKHVNNLSNNDWKDEKAFEKGFNYGTKPANTKLAGVYGTKTHHFNTHSSTHNSAHNNAHSNAHSAHSNAHSNVYPTHVNTHAHVNIQCPIRSDVPASSQSMESYNHGGVTGNNAEQTYSVPHPSMIVLEVKATLAGAADYLKSQSTAVPRSWSYPQSHPVPIHAPDTYSLSLGPHLNVPYMNTAVPHVTKVKNILLSVIPPGISAPRGPGGTSPQGLFTPMPILNSQVIRRQQLSDHKKDTLGISTPVYRNLPSSHSNAPEPL